MLFLKFEHFLEKHKTRFLIGIFVFFGLSFTLLSLGNHFAFRTYAYDLGLFNNALYDYANFRWNSNSVKLYNNILSDHFTLLHIPFAPFSWIFGSYTLLIFQVASILVGAWGAYKYHLLRSGRPGFSIIMLLHFLVLWGIYSALAYDYHDNIIAAMMVPWLFYNFHRQQWRKASFFFLIILISKENMALWAIFLSLGLAWIYFKNKKQLKIALLYGLIAAIYFIIVVKFIIPALTVGDRSYDYVNKYAVLGNGFSDILLSTVKDPIRVIRLLFENHTPDPTNDGIKLELHKFIMISGGWTFFMQPVYLLMLIPIYAQKLFSNHFLAWGINFQYSIEYVPIINFSLAAFALKFTRNRSLLIVTAMLLITGTLTFRSFQDRVAKWLDKSAYQFYKKKHYRNYFDITDAYEALKLIPKDVPVSSSSQFVPHLAFREHIFELPVVGDAEYLIYLENEYPTEEADVEGWKRINKVLEIANSPDWEKFYHQNCIMIFRRKPGTPINEPVIYQ